MGRHFSDRSSILSEGNPWKPLGKEGAVNDGTIHGTTETTILVHETNHEPNRDRDDIARCNSKVSRVRNDCPRLGYHSILQQIESEEYRVLSQNWIQRNSSPDWPPFLLAKTTWLSHGFPWFLVDGPLNPISLILPKSSSSWMRYTCLDTNHQLNEIRPWFHSNTARSLSHRRWWHYCRTQNFPKFRLLITFQCNYYSTVSVP